MSIPTVAVTCIAYDQNGNPVAGGLFRARLDRTETYNGFVVPEQVTGTADANGVVVLQLWPNALGVAGSSYRVTAINPDTRQQYLNTTAVVPNSACNLHEIIVAAPYPPVDASEQALIAAQGALALVTAQANIATNAATEAEGHADDAEDSATDAQGFAANASASFVDFDKRYLGTKTSDPIVDNQGNALQIGALYYLNNVGLRIYDGSIWSAAYISESGTLTTSDIGVTVQAQSANLNDFAAKTAPSGDVVGTTDTQTLTNKSISGTDNTLTSIANSSLVNSSVTVNGQTVALGASTTVTATATNPLTIGTGLNGSSYNGSAPVTVSLANTTVTAGSYGSASNTLTATANAQGQLTALAATPIAIANTQVSGLGTASVLDAAVALGTATLDAGGKVPLSQIPASIQGGVSYQGSWNANTNTPTIVSGTGAKGHYYVVSVAGTTTIDGISDWLASDWIIFNGTAWEKIDNTDSVTSVNGYIGAVSLNAADVGAPPTTRTITAGTGLTGGGDLSANRTIEIDSSVVTLTGSQTLTNKTLTSPSITTPTGIVKGDVGLGNVDNTSDLNKPISTATQTALDNKVDKVAGKGLSTEDYTTSEKNKLAGIETGAQVNTVTSVAGKTGAVTLNRDDVGLGNVDNTSDSTKNSATATLTNKTINLTDNTLQATSAQIAAAVTDETGTGALVFANSPTFVTPALGTPASGVVTNLTGTASININGTVGATTANTGAFTTLSATGAVTLDAATANGVAFANASKVLTTGSALTFDGTNLGVGAGSAVENYIAVNAATFAWQRFRIGGTDRGYIGTPNSFLTGGAGTDFGVSAINNLVFGIGSSEQMRLTSTGLGIGTSSPAQKLAVYSAATDVTGISLQNASTGGHHYVLASAGQAQFYDALAGSFALRDITAGATRFVVDSSGNLGLGVTPSAMNTITAMQLGSTAIIAGQQSGAEALYLGSNWYYNSGWKYKQNGYASRYGQDSGQHTWYTAPSGTAGNAISFTQAMTLTAAGDLGIGTSSPSVKLDVLGKAKVDVGSFASGYALTLAATSETARTYQIGLVSGVGGADLAIYDSTAAAQRVVLDTSGNLGLGVTPPASGARSLYIAGAAGGYTALALGASGGDYGRIGYGFATTGSSGVYNYGVNDTASMLGFTAGGFQFYTAPSGTAGDAISFTQAMRLTAAGELLVGTTSPITGYTDAFLHVATVNNGKRGITIGNSSGSSDTGCVTFVNSNGQVGFILTSGTTTTYNTSSDYRLKNITGPITTSGAYIDSLNPVEGTWKADGSTFVGLIAHEVQEASRTQVATGVKDGEEMQGMDYSSAEIIANLIAEVKSLRQRLAAAGI